MAIAISELKHESIDPDPNNPRQIFDEAQLRELADDISIRGILQPIVVRPAKTKGRYMIVFGERRWRAAALVDLSTVPCIVREMNDLDVLEAQIAENNKRSDVHPLEEADAYRRLHEDHGRDIDELAELCGKSKAYIYAAIKLCALTAEPRKAFLAGKLDKSRALLVARLPEKQQAAACREILDGGDHYDGDGTMSYREAARWIRDEFYLRLANAPFKLTDATLAAKAGPCTTCPKRTGNQRELFDDIVADKRDGGEDVCTDAECYKAKVDVHVRRVEQAARDRRREVVRGEAAQHAGGYNDKRLIDIDARAHDVGQPNKTYRELLGKRAEEVVATVAITDNGQVRELVGRKNVVEELKAAGVKLPTGHNGTATHAGARELQEENQRN